MGGAIALALVLAVRAGAEEPRIGNDAIDAFARPFLTGQLPDGAYDIYPRVQVHLKTEIAMALAAAATGDPRYGDSAQRDHAHVARYFLEPSGGLTWEGPLSDQFFECHQHWFLIASHLISEVTDTVPGTVVQRRMVWTFLQRSNPAGEDFYLHNFSHNGAFFAYRSVDRDGHFMTQVPIKGSYEVGVALWSLSILRATGELDPEGTRDSVSVAAYLARSVAQAVLPPDQNGFYLPSAGRWIRSLRWHNPGWWGYDAPDWKYALHMEEGALEYRYATGETVLDTPIHAMLGQLLDQIQADGSIADFPDGAGAPEYEYGQALSVLGTAAIAFAHLDPLLAVTCLRGGEAVAGYVMANLDPGATEDAAMLLGGLSRVVLAQQELAALAMDAGDAVGAAAPSLALAPSAADGARTIRWTLPARGEARLRVIDVAGRQLASLPLPSDAGGSLVWEPRDGDGRALAAGRYFMVLDLPAGEVTRPFLVVR